MPFTLRTIEAFNNKKYCENIEELLYRRWDVDVDNCAVQGEHRAGQLRPVLAVHLQQPGGGQPQHPVRLQQGDLQHPALQVE